MPSIIECHKGRLRNSLRQSWSFYMRMLWYTFATNKGSSTYVCQSIWHVPPEFSPFFVCGKWCFHWNYSQLSPCGHPAISDTPIIRTAAKSPAKTCYRCLTEINSRYYGHSLMRTLTRGPHSVRYKGSWLYWEVMFNALGHSGAWAPWRFF